MPKPGPAKGTGGRPRKKNTKPGKLGYARVTTGPKGKGTQKLAHRAKLGLPKGSKGSKKVVDHKDGNQANNARSNLRMLSRGKNANRGK